MVAQSHRSTAANQVNPISRWEDDGGPVAGAACAMAQNASVVNVGSVERILSVFSGAVLLKYGFTRLSVPGFVAAIAGGGLMLRGITGHCSVYGALGVSSDNGRSPLHPGDADRASLGTATVGGPVEFRTSSTPPAHDEIEDSPAVLNTSTAAAPATPESRPPYRSEAGSGIPPEGAYASPPTVTHPPVRYFDGTHGPDEPQGRT